MTTATSAKKKLNVDAPPHGGIAEARHEPTNVVEEISTSTLHPVAGKKRALSNWTQQLQKALKVERAVVRKSPRKGVGTKDYRDGLSKEQAQKEDEWNEEEEEDEEAEEEEEGDKEADEDKEEEEGEDEKAEAEAEAEAEEGEKEEEEAKAKEEKEKQEEQEKEKESTVKGLRATFVQATPVDGTLVVMQEWIASWTFRNTGHVTWPSGVRLVARRERHKSFSEGTPSQSQVKPGDLHTFKVSFKMKPAKPRYYNCSFGLQVSERLSGQYRFAPMHYPFLAFFYADRQPLPKELAMQRVRVHSEKRSFIISYDKQQLFSGVKILKIEFDWSKHKQYLFEIFPEQNMLTRSTKCVPTDALGERQYFDIVLDKHKTLRDPGVYSFKSVSPHLSYLEERLKKGTNVAFSRAFKEFPSMHDECQSCPFEGEILECKSCRRWWHASCAKNDKNCCIDKQQPCTLLPLEFQFI